MKNLIKSLAIMLVVGFTNITAYADTEKQTQTSSVFTPQMPIEKVSKSLSSAERKVRNAAVKVVTSGGHGSGTVVSYKDLTVVFTARHVTNGRLGTEYLISKDVEQRTGTLVYQSKEHDVAILVVLNKFSYIKPMPWNPVTNYDIGTDIIYSGHPSWHKLMSFDGRIVGYEEVTGSGTQLIVNTYGWFGCSGSGVYNRKGQLLGILYGVDVQYAFGNQKQIQESLIWVAPIKNIDMKSALSAFCRGTVENYKACR